MSTFFEDKTCYVIQDNQNNFVAKDISTRRVINYITDLQVSHFQLENGDLIKCRVKYTDDNTLQPRPVTDEESKNNLYIIEKVSSLNNLTESQIEEIREIVNEEVKSIIENNLVVYDENGMPLKYKFEVNKI